jgi:predicted nucleic acid-binding protein
MPFVLDASIAARWLLPDERTAAIDSLAFQLETEDALAPDLFWHEMRNLLITAFKRNRISEAEVFMSLSRLTTIPLRGTGPSDSVAVTRLAIKHDLSAYDAAYLALALIGQLPLATLDKRLAEAAGAEGVAVLPEGSP